MAHHSQYNARPINPPDTPVKRGAPATEAEKEFAIELNKQMPGEYRAIARRVTRQFGNMRNDTTVRNWIRNA